MIQETGAWKGLNVSDHHFFDIRVADEILRYIRSDSILDLGCGSGEYVKHFIGNNIYSDGYDGNPDTPKLSGYTCSVMDLSVIKKVTGNYDWVLSLEVGEHIPAKYESNYIENLDINNKKGIILSWAIPDQLGYGHVNCKDNEYIKSIFHELGYLNNLETEKKLREVSRLPWFKNTIMVFERFV
tara:strand:- start:72 stop:623 length:552 start_codon:yes stop_codon:yes gene_type:complete